MGVPYNLVTPEDAKRNAMAMWKARQENMQMQGPPTEIQMLRDEVRRLRAQLDDQQYAAALTAHEANRGRF